MSHKCGSGRRCSCRQRLCIPRPLRDGKLIAYNSSFVTLSSVAGVPGQVAVLDFAGSSSNTTGAPILSLTQSDLNGSAFSLATGPYQRVNAAFTWIIVAGAVIPPGGAILHLRVYCNIQGTDALTRIFSLDKPIGSGTLAVDTLYKAFVHDAPLDQGGVPAGDVYALLTTAELSVPGAVDVLFVDSTVSASVEYLRN